MDLLTTYKKDYNPYPISRVSPCVPQAQTYFSDAKMDTVPTYKSKCSRNCTLTTLFW